VDCWHADDAWLVASGCDLQRSLGADLSHRVLIPGRRLRTATPSNVQTGFPGESRGCCERIAVQPAEYVAPGQVAWFQFNIVAPAIQGTYRLAIRPLIEGAQWMEDYGVFWFVTVLPGAAAAPTPTPLPGPDTTPPKLSSISLSPAAVDVSSADQRVDLTARITDDLSGVADSRYASSQSQVRFRSPSGNQLVSRSQAAPSTLCGCRTARLVQPHTPSQQVKRDETASDQ